MRDRELPCPTCGTVTLFEQPPCLDGHGAGCDELMCQHCGSAYFVAPLTQPSPAEELPAGPVPTGPWSQVA